MEDPKGKDRKGAGEDKCEERPAKRPRLSLDVPGWERPLFLFRRDKTEKLQILAVRDVLDRAPAYVVRHWNEDMSWDFSRVCNAAFSYEDAKRACIDACLEWKGKFFLQGVRYSANIDPELDAVETLQELKDAGYVDEKGKFLPMDWATKMRFIKTVLKADFETDGGDGNPYIFCVAQPGDSWYFMIERVQIKRYVD